MISQLLPGVDPDLSEDQLADQKRRWTGLEHWSEAWAFARELAERNPDDAARVRDAAECAARAGADDASVELWLRLRRIAPLEGEDERNLIAALIRLEAFRQAALELENARLEASPDLLDVDFAARAWHELHTRVLSRTGEGPETNPAMDPGDPRQDPWQDPPKGAGTDADAQLWGARALEACLAMGPLVDSDADARLVLDRLWAWRRDVRVAALPDLARAIVEATISLGRENWPRSLGYAAFVLSDEEPAWTLANTSKGSDDTEVIEARIQAHLVLQENHQAMAELDHLARVWGPLDGLSPDTWLRYQWARTLLEVGRIHEADEVCGRTRDQLATRVRELETDAEVEAQWTQARILQAMYAVDHGRMAYLAGRYTTAWQRFWEAVQLDHEALDRSTRATLAHIRVVMASDVETAAEALSAVWSATDTAAGVVGGHLETTFIESSLWAAGRWEGPDGRWESLGSSGSDKQLEDLREARARGLVMARELLSRIADGRGLTQQLRLALLAGDELRAEALLHEIDGDDALCARWDVRVLRAVCALQSGRDSDALADMRLVMAEHRHDPDLRVLYAHAALLAGEVDEAAQEAHEIVEMLPEHVMARVMRAECSFELALRRGLRTGSGEQHHGPDGDRAKAASESNSSEAQAMENVQQLIAAVSDYHHAVVLDARTKDFMVDERIQAPLGSDVLTPRQLMQVCRRSLHAAIIAQEGLDRLGLTRDRDLEEQAARLVRSMRSGRASSPCEVCAADPRRPVDGMVHRFRQHRSDRDEPARLAHLLTSYRRARRRRIGFASASVAFGLTLCTIVIANAWNVDKNVPGLAVSTIRATVLAFGLLLMVVPFVRSIKVGSFELTRPDRAPPVSGRSKALRASTVLQRNALLTTTTSLLPSVTARVEDKTARMERPGTEATRQGLDDPDHRKTAPGGDDADAVQASHGGGKPAGAP